MRLLVCHLRRELPKWSNVVEYPERAAVRTNDEIIAMHDQIADRRDRKIQAKTLPVFTVIEGHIYGPFGGGIQETFAFRVFANRIHGLALADPGHSLLPGLTTIVSPVNVRMQVI